MAEQDNKKRGFASLKEFEKEGSSAENGTQQENNPEKVQEDNKKDEKE